MECYLIIYPSECIIQKLSFCYFLIKSMMYMGKQAGQAKKQAQLKRNQAVKVEMHKNSEKVKQVYESFQNNMGQFAKKYKHEINSDSKFRDKFSDMCQEFDVNPMMAQKNIWSQLGFGDFYHNLAMKVLDICAKSKHENGGIMKIEQIKKKYNRKEKNQISNNDIIRAMDKVYMLGNASIIDRQYVCTVPIELNSNISELLSIAEQYGFMSAKLLKKLKNWTPEQFQTRVMDLRRKGIIWVDRKVPNQPHYYFLSHLGTDFKQFLKFMKQF